MTARESNRSTRAVPAPTAEAASETREGHLRKSSVSGKVAMITGAASGIGLAAARLLASQGAKVVLADSDAEAGARQCAALQAEGWRALFVCTDVASEADVAAAVKRSEEHYGGLHILFNNAGVSMREMLTTEVALDRWTRILAVNLTGTFLAMKHAIPAMLRSGGGSVINNASVAGLVGLPKNAAYAASKGGVVQLTRTAALEFATSGVRVNCICPGFVETALLGGTEQTDANRAKLLGFLQPMTRLGGVDEIAELVLFLASDSASFMTGAVIPIDGGYVAR